RITYDGCLFKRSTFKLAQVAPQMCLVDVVDCGAKRGHVFVAERARLFEKRRDLFTRRFSLLCSDAQVKAPITRSIWTPLAFDVERYDASAVVECDAIDERYERRLDLFTTDSHEVFLNSFRIVNTFDSQLIVYSEDDHTSSGVCEGHDLLRDLFGV